jgi:3-polyprenyl-4-hydroxybenzoate decarboxylase
LEEAIDFVVGRICDQLGVEHQLLERWGEQSKTNPKSEYNK